MVCASDGTISFHEASQQKLGANWTKVLSLTDKIFKAYEKVNFDVRNLNSLRQGAVSHTQNKVARINATV